MLAQRAREAVRLAKRPLCICYTSPDGWLLGQIRNAKLATLTATDVAEKGDC